jgi:hypothetical protein
MAETPSVAALMPECDHGDTDEKPSPAPSSNNTSDNAAAPVAPASTAAHDMPDATFGVSASVAKRSALTGVFIFLSPLG